MSWIYLVFAGLLEVVWAYFMKKSAGFTRPVPSLITAVTLLANFGLLSLAMRTLPLGTAYTIWTGTGAMGAFLQAYLWLGVWEENPKAIRFYEKNGFIAFDKHVFRFGEDEQIDVMMKKGLN